MSHVTDLETRIRIRNRALLGLALVVALLIHPLLGLAVGIVILARAIGRRRRLRGEAAARVRPETPAERSERIGRYL